MRNHMKTAVLSLVLSISTTLIAQTAVTTSGGTTNSIPLYSGSFTLSNSVLTQYNGNIGLGTATPIQPLTIINDGFSPIYGGNDTNTANSIVVLGKVPFIEIVGNNDGNHPPAIGLVQTSVGNTNSFQDPSELYLGGTRAASASTAGTGPVGNTDILGRIGFFGDDGSTLRTRAAVIDAEVYTANTPVSSQSVPAALNLATFSSAPIIFYTNAGTGWGWNQLVGNASERMRINYNGNVGIGTASPGAKLEVNGNLKLSSGSGASITFPDGTVQSTAFISGSSGITQTNGNVGIGTTNPATTLDVNGYATFGSATSRLSMGSDSLAFNRYTATGQIYNSGELAYQFQHTGSTTQGSDFLGLQIYGGAGNNITPYAWVVNGYGNVGIGTPSPAVPLDVNGFLHVSGNTNPTTTAQGGYLSWNALTGGAGETDFINNPGGGSGGFAFMNTPSSGNPRTTLMVLSGQGNLQVNGNVKLGSGSGASITFADGTVQSTAYTGVTCGGDYAESVDVSGGRTNYEPGDVLVIDPATPGRFLKSAEAYSTSVAGIYSAKPGYVGRRQTTPKSPEEVPMAMVGIVPTKVSVENGPIKPGDLLVASSTLGQAMKGTDRERMLGAVIGKALGNLDSGTGVIEVLVTLQ